MLHIQRTLYCDLPSLIEDLAHQRLKMYPQIAGVCREDATDDIPTLKSWFKNNENCDWAVATGDESNVVVLEAIDSSGMATINGLVKNHNLPDPDGDIEILWMITQDERPLIFLRYPQGKQSVKANVVHFSEDGLILHVEEGSVTFPKQYLYKPIGQAHIPKCPDWLSDSDAFIDIEERSSGNDSGPEKPTAIGVPKERDLENKMLA